MWKLISGSSQVWEDQDEAAADSVSEQLLSCAGQHLLAVSSGAGWDKGGTTMPFCGRALRPLQNSAKPFFKGYF